MNGFRGRFGSGTFVAVDRRGAPPESYLGCDVVMRGYLANRAALISRFALHPARCASDGALIAHAFRTWGSDLQAHVFGEYAAVVRDERTYTGLLTHDALGVEPLFYAPDADGVAFATDLIDLVDAGAAAQLDEEYIADFFAYGVVTNERTPYRAIRRLLPGRSLRWSGTELREIRTWNLAHVPPLRCRDDAEYEERFRALLDAGVRAALDVPGRTGVSLSGGLDSSTIACVAARAGHDLGAYSFVAPRWPEVDEQRWMRDVVDAHGLRWHRADVEAALPFATLPAEFLGEPTGAVADEKRRRNHNETLASHGVSVMLTGHGGDAVLCAAPGPVPRHLADPLFDGNALGALRSVSAWKRASPQTRSYGYWIARGLISPALDHLGGNRVRSEESELPAWLDPAYARSIGLERRSRRRVAPPCRGPGRQALWDELWISSLNTTAMPRRPMTYETRKPLLYLPLVEFMASIPWEQKLRPRCDRYLQRRALKGILPESVRRRAGKAWGSPPFIEGLRRSRDWIGYLCDAPKMAERGMVDAGRWRQAVHAASVGQTHGDKYFFSGVAVETWLRQLSEI